jgi:hypothetical protein
VSTVFTPAKTLRDEHECRIAEALVALSFVGTVRAHRDAASAPMPS